MRHSAWSALFMVPALVAQAPPQEAQRIERLVGIGKLWGKIRVLHPDLATKPIDWDKALVDAIAKINSAKSRGDYGDAVRTMLSALGDPATGLASVWSPSLLELPKDLKPFTWLSDGTLLVHLNDPARFQNTDAERIRYCASLKMEIQKASRIILDLRPDKTSQPWTSDETGLAEWYLGSVLESLIPEVIDTPLLLPAKRIRAHRGHRGDVGSGYSNGVFLEGGMAVQSSGRRKQLAFLINDYSSVPGEIMALQKTGQALIITEGSRDRDWAAMVSSLRLEEGLTVNFRKADWVFVDGSTGCRSDIQTPPSAHMDAMNPGIQAALNRWTHPESKEEAAKESLSSLVPKFRADAPYGDTSLPSSEYRILAAIKFWTTIDWFFPYKKLMDRPWEGVLAELIPSMENAGNAQTYQLAVSAMVARIQDSHGFLEMAKGSMYEGGEPEGLKTYFGTGTVPVALAMVEGRPVAINTWGVIPEQMGFRVGDEILHVDGEPIQSRMDRIHPYISASTPHRLDFRVANRLLRGPLGKTGEIGIRRANGSIATLKVTWSEVGPKFNGGWRNGPEFKLLSPTLGYVDFDRLRPDQAKAMVASMRQVQAVIIDLRGYPTSAVLEVGNCFAKNPKAICAMFRSPLILGEPDPEGEPLMAADASGSFGMPQDSLGCKVVVLIDERAQSAAEHWGLILEASSQATFIGSPTSGANGNVTTLVLPGALRVHFTGMDVRHGDGRQLQRVGLQPHILVRPTIKGIAEGRDEVLERAIRFVEEGH